MIMGKRFLLHTVNSAVDKHGERISLKGERMERIRYIVRLIAEVVEGWFANRIGSIEPGWTYKPMPVKIPRSEKY